MGKPKSNRDRTAESTRRILDFLFDQKVIAHRNNTLPVPLVRNGLFTGFRPGSRSGRPDIEGILPNGGKALLVEIKTGNDHLSPIQKSYFSQASKVGAVVLVVKSFEDFRQQWKTQKLSTPSVKIYA